MIYDLPTTVELNGVDYPINSDFRCVLDIMEVLSDRDLSDRERVFLALGFFYPDLQSIPPEAMETAVRKLYWFINGGQDQKPSHKKAKKMMDWGQDFPYIIGPVNRIIGHDIRLDKHLHWWTFLSAYMDIGESLFSQILHIRQALAEGGMRKLSKPEREWYRKNRDLVDLKNVHTYTDAELAFFGSIQGGE